MTAGAEVMTAVALVFADADLAAVNLETPLIKNPCHDPTQPRPARFDPTGFPFATRPAGATALPGVGIDVVDLGTNHLYDALGTRVRSTRAALSDARFAPPAGFRSGRRNDQAFLRLNSASTSSGGPSMCAGKYVIGSVDVGTRRESPAEGRSSKYPAVGSLAVRHNGSQVKLHRKDAYLGDTMYPNAIGRMHHSIPLDVNCTSA